MNGQLNLAARRIPAALATLATLFTLLAGAAPVSAAAPEGLDPTFDGDGRLLSALGHEPINARAVLVQPADGKIVVAGSQQVEGGSDFLLLRYCPDGSLDDGIACGGSGFGAGGRVLADFGSDFYDYAYDAALQPDGKIVAVGSSYRSPDIDMAVARFNPDGSPDASFDGDGLVRVAFTGGDARAYAVEVQPDGKIVIGGETSPATWSDFALARLCPNGALDDGFNCGPSPFGAGGRVISDFSGSADWVDGLALYGDKIIAGGSGGSRDFAVARYNADGSLDTGFSGDGKATASFGTGWDYGQDVVVQTDGKIVVAGGGYYSDWNHDFGLVRFTVNGTLDPSFSGDGKVLTEFYGQDDRILGLTMVGDHVLAAGYAYRYDGEMAAALYSPDGSLDPSFDGDGMVVTDILGSNDAAYGVAVQSDGKFVVTGDGDDDGGESAVALLRYNPAGALDPAFGGDGRVTTGAGHHLGSGVAAAAGKILVAGWANDQGSDDFSLVRLNDAGGIDAGFGAGGEAAADFGAADDTAAAIAVQSDGKIVLAGSTFRGNNGDFAVARFCPDGALDDGVHCGKPGFGAGGTATADFGGKDFGRAVLIQPDGAIVVAGITRSYPASDFAVARFTAAGSLDTSFDGDGKAAVDFAGQWDEGMGVARQPDGKLVVAGRSYATYSTMDFALVRLCAGGGLDDGVACGGEGFGVGGKTTTDFFGYADRATAVAVQDDGKIVAAGEARDGSADFALARYCPNGALDDGVTCGGPAFGVGGQATADFAGKSDGAAALVLLRDGRILAGGTMERASTDGGGYDFGLALFLRDGSLDARFGADGRQTVDFGSDDEQAYALALQADGKMLIGGDSGGHLALARFLPAPADVYLPIVLR